MLCLERNVNVTIIVFWYYQMTALLSELSLNHIPKKAPQAHEETTKLQYIDDTAQCDAGEYDPLTL